MPRQVQQRPSTDSGRRRRGHIATQRDIEGEEVSIREEPLGKGAR